MRGRHHSGRSCATRAAIALVAALGCVGGIAYAAAHPDEGRSSGEEAGKRPPGNGRPTRPRFIEVPSAVEVGASVQFRFHVAPPAPGRADHATPRQPDPPAVKWPRFRCRFDGGDWTRCSSPYALTDLEPGDHSFAVQALNRRQQSGPAAHYQWSQLEPKKFTIDPQPGSLEELMPGAPPQELPVRVGNPNPVPIEITSLTVAVTPEPPGCPADPNFAVTPSTLTPASPLSVPAGGSVDLPAAAAPTIGLRELPSDQNACQGATVSIAFRGEARG
jgi:hypothetical protein